MKKIIIIAAIFFQIIYQGFAITNNSEDKVPPGYAYITVQGSGLNHCENVQIGVTVFGVTYYKDYIGQGTYSFEIGEGTGTVTSSVNLNGCVTCPIACGSFTGSWDYRNPVYLTINAKCDAE